MPSINDRLLSGLFSAKAYGSEGPFRFPCYRIYLSVAGLITVRSILPSASEQSGVRAEKPKSVFVAGYLFAKSVTDHFPIHHYYLTARPYFHHRGRLLSHIVFVFCPVRDI
jgi:hypothetical protein